MNLLKEQLKKLIKIKTDQYFSDIKDTHAQADFIGHCIIKGFELGKKEEQKSKIIAIEKKMLKDSFIDDLVELRVNAKLKEIYKGIEGICNIKK